MSITDVSINEAIMGKLAEANLSLPARKSFLRAVNLVRGGADGMVSRPSPMRLTSPSGPAAASIL